MKNMGGIMFFVGAISIAVSFSGLDITFLSWIDYWGFMVGWVIRAVLIVGGGALWFIGNTKKAEHPGEDGEPSA